MKRLLLLAQAPGIQPPQLMPAPRVGARPIVPGNAAPSETLPDNCQVALLLKDKDGVASEVAVGSG